MIEEPAYFERVARMEGARGEEAAQRVGQAVEYRARIAALVASRSPPAPRRRRRRPANPQQGWGAACGLAADGGPDNAPRALYVHVYELALEAA